MGDCLEHDPMATQLSLELPCSVKLFPPTFLPLFDPSLESDLTGVCKFSWPLFIFPHFLCQAFPLINSCTFSLVLTSLYLLEDPAYHTRYE